eukprot:1147132-Pelagomonas_calceolata.AAC.2
MVEWVYSRPGGLEFAAQQLRLDQWDPKEWARNSSNGAAGMVFVRPISGPGECPLHPMEPRDSSNKGSTSSPSTSCQQQPPSHTQATTVDAAAAAPVGQQGPPNGMCKEEEVPELEGHIDVDNCCGRSQALQASPDVAATPASLSSAANRQISKESSIEHHPPPYLSHIVPFHDPSAGSHTVGSSSHILGGESYSYRGGDGVSEPTAEAVYGVATSLGVPSARSRRRFRARLRSNIDSTGAGSSRKGGCAGALQQVAYYGLVAQSAQQQHESEAAWPSNKPPSLSRSGDGCYVLKTTRNVEANGGCTCTLFTLTRVCHSGPSVFQQLQGPGVCTQESRQAAVDVSSLDQRHVLRPAGLRADSRIQVNSEGQCIFVWSVPRGNWQFMSRMVHVDSLAGRERRVFAKL